MKVNLTQTRRANGKLLEVSIRDIDEHSPVAQLLVGYQAVTVEDNNQRYRYTRVTDASHSS